MHKTLIGCFAGTLALVAHTGLAQQAPAAPAPSVRLVSITILVKDYEAAAKWYSTNLGFDVQDNKSPTADRRWVTMTTKENPSFRVILHKPGNGHMDIDKRLSSDRIGKETYWILQTSDFDAFLRRLRANKVSLRSDVHTERWGKEVVFSDLYGNLWVVQEATSANQLVPRP